MPEIEKDFIARLNAKEDKAFRELFRLFYRYLVVYGVRIIKNVEESKDIVQDVFVAVWKSKKDWNSFEGLRSFLYESVKNGCLNYLKHKKQEQAYAEYYLRTTEEAVEETENYEMIREEVLRRVYRLAEELPEGCRKVFLQHLDGKKNEEIAELFKISVETVKSQKKKAINYVRDNLGDIYLLVLFCSL